MAFLGKQGSCILQNKFQENSTELDTLKIGEGQAQCPKKYSFYKQSLGTKRAWVDIVFYFVLPINHPKVRIIIGIRQNTLVYREFGGNLLV